MCAKHEQEFKILKPETTLLHIDSVTYKQIEFLCHLLLLRICSAHHAIILHSLILYFFVEMSHKVYSVAEQTIKEKKS